MNYLDNENVILLVLAGIKAPLSDLDNARRRAQTQEAIQLALQKETLFKLNDNLAFLSSLSDITIKLRDKVSGKLKVSQFKSILKDLLNAPHSEKKSIMISSAKKMKLSLSNEILEAFSALYEVVKPIQTKHFFISLLNRTEIGNIADIIDFAKKFGIKLPSNEAKNILGFKQLFESSEHAGALQDIISNLLDLAIPHKDLSSCLMEQAQTRGYHFTENHIKQLVALRKNYLDALNDYADPSPIKNILKTIAFSTGVMYFSPDLTAFKVNHRVQKKLLSGTSLFFSALSGLLSFTGIEFADITATKALKTYIADFIKTYPTESIILFAALNIAEYNTDDLQLLYRKARAWIDDPLNLGDDMNQIVNNSFDGMSGSPTPIIFPKRNNDIKEKFDYMDQTNRSVHSLSKKN